MKTIITIDNKSMGMAECENCGNKIHSELGGPECAVCIMDKDEK